MLDAFDFCVLGHVLVDIFADIFEGEGIALFLSMLDETDGLFFDYRR